MVRRADFNFERRDPEQANFRFSDEGPIKAIFKIAPPTVNYELLINKPKINHIELIGDKSLEDLGITAEIIELIAQHNTSEEAHEFIRNLIAQEVIDREAADILLDGKIIQEILDRKDADNQLQTNIDNEARDRQIEDSNLNGKIVNEALLRENADAQLQHSIDLEAQARTQADTTLGGRIDGINALIPSEATSTNKLADKAYVLDLVKVNGASYRGSWATWAAVPTDPSLYPEDAQGDRTPNANDYMIVTADETQDGGTWMYKYTGTWATDGKNGWLVEYEIEKTPFTPEQQAAIDSGITSTLVGQITTNQEDISDINTTIDGYGDIVTHNVAEFATSAQGALADTALQPNDNISELNNDVGYTTNIGTVTSVNNIEPVDGNVTIEIPDSATWGNITGTLSNQTDLQAALDGKIDKYTTMPAVTASDVGKIAQFVGATNYNYTNGYFYKVVEFPANSVTFTPLGDTTTVVTVDPDDFAAFVRSKCTGDIDRGTDGTDITHGRIGIYSSDRYSFSASTPERGVFALSFPISELQEAGFTFTPPFGAQQGVDYTCTISTASGYGWQRIDVQPATDISGKVDKLSTPATAGTYTKVTINSDGLVSSGTTLSSTDIPSLTLSKISDVTATAAEVNVLDGITASTAELNILDGATLSTTELNYVDGVTSSIQTQLDGKVDENTAITGDTKCKITYDSKGLVTAGANLEAADIPALTLSKISDVTASAEEVNILDGATISTSELNVLDGITASTVELNILDGVTASTSEINILDGITATTTELNYTDGVTSNIQAQFNSITEKIPTQATSQNQLADKDFVNSSISTNTANFIGTFENESALEAYSGTVTNNDYAFVVNSVVTNNGNDWTTFADLDAYSKAHLTNFDYAWVINGSNFDLYRFDIINQEWVSRATNIEKTSVTLNTAYNRYKATVANSIVTWEYEYTLNNSSFTASQWAAINSGITDDLVGDIQTAVQPGDLATVATTGNYNDLSNLPTIGNGLITLMAGRVAAGSFRLNQTGNNQIYLPHNTCCGTNGIQVGPDYPQGIEKVSIIQSDSEKSYNIAAYNYFRLDDEGRVLNASKGNKAYAYPVPENTFLQYFNTASSWEIGFKIDMPSSSIPSVMDIMYIIPSTTTHRIWLDKGKLRFDSVLSNESTLSITSSTACPAGNCWCRVKFTGSKYSLEISVDGTTFTEVAYENSSVKLVSSSSAWVVGGDYTSSAKLSIPDCYVKVNGEYLWQGVSGGVAKATTSLYGLVKPDGTTISINDGVISGFSGDYDDLSNKPTIPTVNNATLTIQKNSTDVATFTANASNNVVANISVPTDTSDLTNNTGFITGITSTDVTAALGYTPYDSSNPSGYTSNVGTVTSVNNVSPVNGNVSLTIPTINSTNNYVPYRSSASGFTDSTLLYNSNAMAFTGKLHVGSSSPASYHDKGKLTIYDNTPSQQVTSMALLNYGGGGGCGVAIDMYNTSANGGIPSGRFGVVDNGNYSGYLQLQVKKSGAASNPLLPAMNIVPVPATSSLTTCVSFGQDEFNRALFDLHKPEATVTISDSDKRWSGSGTTYSQQGSNKFNSRLLVAVGDIVSFDSFATEATVTAIVSNSSTLQITTDVSLGSISNKNISVKKAYFKVTDESNNTKVIIDPYGKMGIGKLSPNYELDVTGTINASTDIKINGSSLATVAKTGDYDDLINKPNVPTITFYWGE